MNFKIFKRIVDEVKNFKVTLFRIASDGEGLLHKDLLRFIRYAKDNGIAPVNLTTNGLLMTGDVSEQLIDSGLDIIDISIDAISPKAYSNIRVGGNFDILMNNINTLIEMKKMKNSPMKIFVSFVKQKENETEAQSFKQYWEHKVDKVLIRNLCNVHGIVDIDNGSGSLQRWPCTQFWKRITITNTGNIRFCVEDWRNESVVGNVMESSIREIWTGKHYNEMREIHLSGSYDKLPFCKDCSDWSASSWDYGYERLVDFPS